MLHDSAKLRDFTLKAADGEVGRVTDLYFDDSSWTIRYLIVDTGNWLRGRKVLISPMQLRAVDRHNSTIAVELSRQQVEQSPDYDTDKPVSRQHEIDFHGYYGMPFYWTGPYLWGAMAYPAWGGAVIPPIAGARGTPTEDEFAFRGERSQQKGDPHLRSVDEVTGYNVQASDGSIGHIATFLVDDVTWSIRAVVVDTRNWLPGKHVVIAPRSIERVDWSERTVYFDISRDAVKESLPYEASSLDSDDYERRLYDHFRDRARALSTG